jgi:glycerol-3-phosphate acyltransferase PlsY
VAAKLGAGETAVALTGLAAFLGHVFPVFLKFRGGKGVATALGVMIGIHWIMALAGVATWLLVAVATRYSSLAALVAAVEAPILTWFLTSRPELTATVAVMSLLLIWRHKANIRRLMAGTESRIGKKKA